MQEWSGVLPSGLPEAQIERIDGALMRPPREEDMRGLRQGCGIFRADGSPVAAAQTRSSDGDLALDVAPPTAPLPQRAGAWLFGGMLFHHFGHALIYSAARLWAVRRLLDDGVPLQGVLFYQRFSADPQPNPALTRHAATIFDSFRPDVPIVTVAEPEQIETLYMPAQGISTLPELFIGLPEQRRFYRDNTARIAPNSAPRDIYVSRTRTGWKGNHLFEKEIERALAAAGYFIFHPEFHSLEEQIATYRSARRLIAVDGSALHVVATAVPSSAKVAILSRRAFFAWAIADQIRAFAGCDVQVIEAHGDVYAFSRGMGRHSSWSTTQVTTDFAHLGAELQRLGFVDQAPDWTLPTEADLAQRFAEAKQKIGDDLIPVPDHIRPKEPHYEAHRTRNG